MLFRTVALLSLSSTALYGAEAKLLRATRFEEPEKKTNQTERNPKALYDQLIQEDRSVSGDTKEDEVDPLAYTDFIRDEERDSGDYFVSFDSMEDTWEESNAEEDPEEDIAYTDFIRNEQPPHAEVLPRDNSNPPLVKWQGESVEFVEPVHEENTNESTETLYGEDGMIETVFEDSNGVITEIYGYDEEPEDEVFDSEVGTDESSDVAEAAAVEAAEAAAAAAGSSFSVDKDANCSGGFDESKGGMTQHCEAGMKQEFSMNVSAQEMNQGIGWALMQQGSQMLPEPDQLVLKNDEMEALFMQLGESNFDVANFEFSGTMKLDWSCKMTFEATKDKGFSKKVECAMKSDSSIGKN
eukprot:scaffold25096_cov181-Cylindrotheca_fusiformis.AAC.1